MNANVQRAVSGGKIYNTVYAAGFSQNSAAGTRDVSYNMMEYVVLRSKTDVEIPDRQQNHIHLEDQCQRMLHLGRILSR